jgi:hypothetical protein
MHMSYGNPGVKAGSGRLWSTLIRLAILVSAAAALLAILLVGLFVVLPLVFLGGIILHLYLRRRLRQA